MIDSNNPQPFLYLMNFNKLQYLKIIFLPFFFYAGMLETGLKQSCNQWSNKSLSPTMSVANIGMDQDDQFLEIHYHNTAAETPSTDLKSGIGGFGDSNMDQHTSFNCPSLPEAPESPTIPRDPAFYDLIASESTDKKVSVSGKSLPVTGGEIKREITPAAVNNQVGSKESHEKLSLRRSRSLSNSTELSVHSSHRSKKEGSVESASSESKGDHKGLVETVVENNESSDSPLSHMEVITHIETVQATLDNDFNHCNNHDHETTGDKNLDLMLSDIKEVKIGDELIDDLDSPESISKIDREDCFSWEQDRLQLSIDHVFTFPTDITLDSRPSSTEREKVSLGESGSEKESTSSDHTNPSTPTHREKSPPLSHSNTLNNEDNSVTKPKKGVVLKNKLSAALHKVSTKSKQKDDSNLDKVESVDVDIKNVGNNLEKVDSVEVNSNTNKSCALPKDDHGYPLSIFTNVSIFLF